MGFAHELFAFACIDYVCCCACWVCGFVLQLSFGTVSCWWGALILVNFNLL